MHVTNQSLIDAIRQYYHHSSGLEAKSVDEIEDIIYTCQKVLDVTRNMPGWSAANIHAICHLACQREITRK